MFNVNSIPADLRERITQAAERARSMQFRHLRCPFCQFRVQTVFADTAGHFQVKCGKCKREIVFRLTPGTNLDFRICRK